MPTLKRCLRFTREICMLVDFYRNKLTVIKQWFDTNYFVPAPNLIRVRINKSEHLQQLSIRQRRVRDLNYKHYE